MKQSVNELHDSWIPGNGPENECSPSGLLFTPQYQEYGVETATNQPKIGSNTRNFAAPENADLLPLLSFVLDPMVCLTDKILKQGPVGLARELAAQNTGSDEVGDAEQFL